MSDTPELPIEEPDLAADFTHREKDLRDKFVKEYLVDYDAKAATIRVGYQQSIAGEYCVRLMNCPYVLQQIKKLELETPEESAEQMRKRVINGLIREANYRGPGCSPGARVAALAKLAAIQGMDAPTRSKTEISGPDGTPLGGGVFVVPGICTVEDWEKAAAAQQTALVAGATIQTSADAPVAPSCPN